jgi:hypothetical protein
MHFWFFKGLKLLFTYIALGSIQNACVRYAFQHFSSYNIQFQHAVLGYQSLCCLLQTHNNKVLKPLHLLQHHITTLSHSDATFCSITSLLFVPD